MEHHVLKFLANSEVHMVGILAALLWRARQAEPLRFSHPTKRGLARFGHHDPNPCDRAEMHPTSNEGSMAKRNRANA